MTKTRRSFTDEFKREAAKLVKQPWAMVTPIALDCGIESTVFRCGVPKEISAQIISTGMYENVKARLG